ncbi:MAG: hypothetical protein JO214_15210, partial [Frankiaceae bacterium]|nr:hypothetical protein [Frankiaceae bacterium]
MALVHPARRLRGIRGLRAAPQPYCQVCFGPATKLHVLREHHSDRTLAVRTCDRCGYVEIPDRIDDDAAAPIAPVAASLRRERAMSKLGVDVLGIPDAAILAVSEHPEALDSEAVEDRYDVVVAADVIDRFGDPLVDFARMFKLLADRGVLICSSTIHDGGALARRRHVFGRGRGSYFTPQSLRRVASVHNVKVDFRLPPPSSKSGARRRYVIFTRSPEVMAAVADYFARNRHAPSHRSP